MLGPGDVEQAGCLDVAARTSPGVAGSPVRGRRTDVWDGDPAVREPSPRAHVYVLRLRTLPGCRYVRLFLYRLDPVVSPT